MSCMIHMPRCRYTSATVFSLWWKLTTENSVCKTHTHLSSRVQNYNYDSCLSRTHNSIELYITLHTLKTVYEWMEWVPFYQRYKNLVERTIWVLPNSILIKPSLKKRKSFPVTPVVLDFRDVNSKLSVHIKSVSKLWAPPHAALEFRPRISCLHSNHVTWTAFDT